MDTDDSLESDDNVEVIVTPAHLLIDRTPEGFRRIKGGNKDGSCKVQNGPSRLMEVSGLERKLWVT